MATSSEITHRPDYDVPGPMDQEPPPPAFRLRKFVNYLARLWWVPVITTMLGMGAAVGFVLWKPAAYVSRAKLWESLKLRLPEGGVFSEDMQTFVGTQTELLQSPILRSKAMLLLKASGTNRVLTGKDGRELPVEIRVSQAAKSAVYSIDATSSNQRYTQAYLTELVTAYLEYKRDVRKDISVGTLTSIESELEKQNATLKTYQDALTAFQRTNNLAILQEEGTTFGGYLAKLNTQLSDYKLELQLLEGMAPRQLTNALPEADTDSLATNTAVAAALSSSTNTPVEGQPAARDIALLKLQRDKLSRNLRPEHPKMVKLNEDITRGEKVLELLRNQSLEQLAANRLNLKLRIASTEAAVQEWQGRVVENNNRIAEAEHLRLDVSRQQSHCDRLASLLQNVDIGRSLDQETLSLLEPASPALRTFKQELTVSSLLILAGISVGIAFVFLAALRDDRFASLLEINEKFGDVIVGQVPEVPLPGRNQTVPLLETDDRRHVYAESYRSLRSAIFYLAADSERPKILLITSASPDEGKSTIAANLARTMALGGSRVLLVDADLRRGLLHDIMAMQRAPGLAELLTQPDALDKFIQSNCLPNLSFLSRGGNVLNPGDLFLGPALNRILDQLRQQFDHVLIDTSPVFAADDATTLAPKVDGTLFVVRKGFSRAGQVREALEMLQQRQARVLGLVFNRADSSARSYYYYKHEEYYHPAKPS